MVGWREWENCQVQGEYQMGDLDRRNLLQEGAVLIARGNRQQEVEEMLATDHRSTLPLHGLAGDSRNGAVHSAIRNTPNATCRHSVEFFPYSWLSTPPGCLLLPTYIWYRSNRVSIVLL